MARNSSKSKRRYDVTGFTLVELVITIAVLAVLSGIGALGYSGYITKANEAHDLALLGAVNTAFQSACTEEEITEYPAPEDDIVAANLLGDEGSKKLDTITFTGYDDFDSVFKKYFEGNEDAEFKVYVELEYVNSNLGTFVGLRPDGTITTASGMKIHPPTVKNGKTTVEVELPGGGKVEYVLEGEDKDNFANSSFGTNMSMPELLDEVDHVVQAAGKVLEQLSPSLMDMILPSSVQELLAANGYTAPKPEDYPGNESDPDYIAALNAYNSARLNAIVMSVAQASKDLSADAVIAAVNSGNYDSLGLGSGNQALVPTAALVYGVLTGYANSDRGSDIITVDGEETTVAEYYKSISDGLNAAEPNISALLGVVQAANILTDPDNGNLEMFNDYLQNGGGKNDIDGYIAAMRAINDNSGSLTTSGALEKGFSDDDLSTILDSLFG